MAKYKFPTAPMALGLVGPIAGTGLRQSFLFSSGNWLIFVTKPLSLTLLILATISLGSAIIKDLRGRKNNLKKLL